ncbi:MEMBRANE PHOSPHOPROTEIN 14 KDA CHLOROPLAST putative-RELATED [Salix purpurea]|uniref:MEMBRANE PHOSPHOPROTEIN 14 kDa CHLOROPLAST putative-RELATED n=1 Tax=Salix purpurea TaxID=77065 RepID=A0A9Q0PEH2_SALPP|nr:MEMBRANE PHOSPHOPROTEIN 14 KDA CHLOROPLAST putative-RELATED [Salix purpurea]
MASTMIAAAASSSMAATAIRNTRCSALPYLRPRSSSSQSFPIKHVSLSESHRFAPLQIRASSSEESSADANEIFTDLKKKWDAVENKSTVILYGGGAIVFVWLSSVVTGAINSVPLLPKIMELVGLGYTGWFVYRYLLFKSSRKELATDIEALKKKIAGTE